MTLRELVANKQKSEDDIEAAKQLIAKKRAEQKAAQAASPVIEDARTALVIIETLITRLETELQSVEERGIERISEALNRVVSSSTRQKYSAQVTRDYAIKLFKSEEGTRKPVQVLSSGERRLLELCFVSALVAVCKEREKEASAILLPGAVAPLVVDAPFGELDPEYQALAATTMMNLSEQLILMLSKTHWTKDVDDAIRPCIGEEYLMIGYKSDPALDARPVTINVAGNTYQQMVFEADRNWTELRSIGRPQ
jgi:DNA sulfur modification protein DndD